MNTFDELISVHKSGETNLELSRELRSLMDKLSERATEDGSASGSITLTLKLEASGSGRVEITATSKVQAPGPRKTSEVRWLGKSGSLESQDPRQATLPLQSRRKEPVS